MHGVFNRARRVVNTGDMTAPTAEPDFDLTIDGFRQTADVLWRVRPGTLLAPGLMGLAIARSGRPQDALAMTAILVGITILGLSVIRLSRQRAEQITWRRALVVTSVAWGLAWGSAPFLLDPSTPASAISRVVPAIGVMAVASVVYAAYLPGFAGLMAGVLVPYITSLVTAGRTIAVEAIPSALTVTGVLVAQTFWANGHNRRVLLDRRRMVELTAWLEEERSVALAANGRLHAVNEHVRRLAERDHLTGAYNRRVLVERFDALGVDERPRHVLAIVDLDHFKQANDRFGHPTGDDILCNLVATMNDLLPSDACLARWGGEEFAVLLPASVPTTLSLMDRIRDELARRLPAGVATTFSAGLAHWSREIEYSELLRRADAALYAAKANGRNRSEVHDTASLGGR